MSEEEKKEQQKPKVISRIALKVGLASFFCVLLMLPWIVWVTIFSIPSDCKSKVLDTIEYCLYGLMFVSYIFLVPLVVTGLVLSIITLFIERNLCYRLLPLACVVVVIGLYYLYYIIFFTFCVFS